MKPADGDDAEDDLLSSPCPSSSELSRPRYGSSPSGSRPAKIAPERTARSSGSVEESMTNYPGANVSVALTTKVAAPASVTQPPRVAAEERLLLRLECATGVTQTQPRAQQASLVRNSRPPCLAEGFASRRLDDEQGASVFEAWKTMWSAAEITRR